MQTFILMTKLSPKLSSNMAQRSDLGHAWLHEVKAKCPEVKFISHYALMGQYDFMDIFEAPNAEMAAKVSMISQANGAVDSESWTAIPYKRFLEMTSEI